MNVGEETEIKLQRVSATLIADAERLLPLLLYRRGRLSEGVRERVKWSNVERFVKLVGLFSILVVLVTDGFFLDRPIPRMASVARSTSSCSHVSYCHCVPKLSRP